LQHYVDELEQRGKYSLTIWPFHAMLGGLGHALVSRSKRRFSSTASPVIAGPTSRSRASTRSPSTTGHRPGGADRARR
jgi:hypothetical protein